MRRNSRSYRLQLIKETVERRERRSCSDPMVQYIDHLLTDHPHGEDELGLQKSRFAGHHYDENAHGWVADTWK